MIKKQKNTTLAEHDNALRALEDKRNVALYHAQGCMDALAATVNQYSRERDETFIALFEWVDEVKSLTIQFEQRLAKAISEDMPRH